MKRRLTAVCACFVFATATLPLAVAEDNDAMLPEVKSIRLGFGNHYKLGCWTPAYIELSGAPGDSGAAGRIDVEAPDGDDVPAWFVGPRIIWTEGATRTAYVRIGRPDNRLHVRLTKLHVEGEPAPELLPGASEAANAVAAPATNELVVQLGASIGLPEMFRHLELAEVERADVVTIDNPQPLPERWYGYEGVDLLVIAGAPAIDHALVNAAAVRAIDRWVHLGGKLVIVCGEGAQTVFAADSPLSRFAPGELAGMVNLPGIQLGPIESFAHGEERLDAPSLRVPQWKNLAASSDVRLRSSDVPLIVQMPRGFGEVIYVGLDLHKPPLSHWLGRSRFLERLLDRRSQPGGHSALEEGPQHGMRLGFLDLTGQLRGALDQFGGVRLVPFWLVALLVLAYIAVLSGLTYTIAVRWLQRPPLAWAILPLAIILFSAAAFFIACRAKGSGRKLNQVDLVDIETSTGQARGTTWVSIFSPKNAMFDMSIAPAFAGMQTEPEAEFELGRAPLFGWLGLPGTGLGGMNSPAVNLPLFDQPYTIDPNLGTMTGVPLSAWSSKCFVARWESAGGGIAAALTQLRDGRLRGSITNQLDVPLTNCVLLFGYGESGWAYTLDRLPPGQEVAIDRLESQSLNTYLTKRRIVTSKEEAAGYDRASFDVDRIVEVMMFHERAGATNYTGLLNRYQNFVDLSDQLETSRAILVAHGPDGATVKIDGEPAPNDEVNRHTTFYRFVLPVASTSGR